MVVKLPREPGKRESRYQHLFSGEVDVESLVVAGNPVASAPVAGVKTATTERIEALEVEVATLKEELAEIKALLQ